MASTAIVVSPRPSMASAEGVELCSRQQQVLERLAHIRDYKQRILNSLKTMNMDETERSPQLKSTFVKLLDSFDAFRRQEDEYLQLLKEIIVS